MNTINTTARTLGNASFLNSWDIQLSLSAHYISDSFFLDKYKYLDAKAMIGIGEVVSDDTFREIISPLYIQLQSGFCDYTFYAKLEKLFDSGYFSTYAYLLNLSTPSGVRPCLLNKVPVKRMTLYLSWVYAKYERSQLNDTLNQPVICNHHQYLSRHSFAVFKELRAGKWTDLSPRVFSPQVCLSNGHLDHIVPSIYEFLTRSNLQNVEAAKPILYTDLYKAANRSIISLLEENGLLQIAPLPTSLSTDSWLRYSFSCDFVELADSLIALDSFGITNVYSDGSSKSSKEAYDSLHRLMCSKIASNGRVYMQKYIAVHVRDAEYKKQEQLSGRDSDINIVVSGIQQSNLPVYKYLRIGVSGRRVIDSGFFAYDSVLTSNVIDDASLLMNCYALIGTSSGPGHYTESIFYKPVLFLGSTTLLPCHIIPRKSVIALKRIISVEGTTNEEMLASLFRVWYDQSCVRHEDLSSVEIASDVNDFYLYSSGMINLPTLATIFPASVFASRTLLEAVTLTTRCYNNLLNIAKDLQQ